MENLIGRKVKGFSFDGADYLCGYSPDMDKNINEIGVITYFNDQLNCYDIDFSNSWVHYGYPAELIEQHLID